MPGRRAARAAGGGDQPAGDGVRKRRSPRARASGGGVGGSGHSACFLEYLKVLGERHRRTGREVILVLDNGPCHTSEASRAALAEREEWLGVIWLARYSPHLNPKEREWRYLKRDARSHLAPTLREFVDGILAGLGRLGGAIQDIVDKVPEWFIAGHRKAPTGRPPGRPKGAKDTRPRKPYNKRKNLPAGT